MAWIKNQFAFPVSLAFASTFTSTVLGLGMAQSMTQLSPEEDLSRISEYVWQSFFTDISLYEQ